MLDDRSYMRSPSYGSQRSATVNLIIVTIACFIVQNIVEYYTSFNVAHYFGLSVDTLAAGWIWQLITFQFLHASVMAGGILHIFFNCLGIYFFGRIIEDALGKAGFLKLYFTSGIVGGIFHVIGSKFLPSHFGGMYGGMHVPVLGASAGVFGLIAANAALFPDRPMTIFIYVIPVTMTARFMLIFSAVFAIFFIVVPTGNVAHGAHLGGLIAGLLYVRWVVHSEWMWSAWRRFRPAPEPPRELVKTASSTRSLWQRSKPAPAEELPPAEFISREVDPILDKISAHGIQSLTDRERKILESARAKMAKR
jgi:membrane associated rhomboid family serine protease